MKEMESVLRVSVAAALLVLIALVVAIDLVEFVTAT